MPQEAVILIRNKQGLENPKCRRVIFPSHRFLELLEPSARLRIREVYITVVILLTLHELVKPFAHQVMMAQGDHCVISLRVPFP